MYCPSCGQALAQQMKYCNRCGAQLATPKDSDLIALFEKRMDSEMEGLFWITVLGVGLILGGIALMKNALHLSDWLTYCFHDSEFDGIHDLLWIGCVASASPFKES